MKKLTITNADNSKISVDLVRYFKFKSDCFLIYTLGEVDEKNYKKLYLVRIMEELGFPVVQTIKNDADWANMQGIVKKVLKELKKNKKNLTEDLNSKEIEGIKVVDPRFFKLESSLVELLASNYQFDDNSSNNSLADQDDSLEPIDETMMRENSNVDYSNENNSDSLDNNVENDITPVMPLPDYSVETDGTEKTIESGMKLLDDDTLIGEKMNNTLETPTSIETIEPIEPNKIEELRPITPNVTVDISNNDTKKESVNYKELYEALKNDNSITNDLLNSVMTELNKYKHLN